MGAKRFSRLHTLLLARSVATWATYISKALPVFLLPPFIFVRFAPEEAAIWFIFITLQGMQLLIAASTDQPMVRGFAYALGGATQVRDMRNVKPSGQSEPNIALLSRVWSASAFAHILIAIATLALLGAMGVWSAAPLISTHSQDQSLWAALAVFVLGGALRAYGGLHVSYLMGVDRIPLLRWWEAAFWLLAFISALTTLLSGGGLLALAIAYQIPLALNIGWNAWLCRRDHRARSGFQTGVRADRDILAQMWPSIWRTGLGTTLFVGTTQGAGLYYATVGEAQDVAAFLFAMSLIRPLGQFAQVPFMTKLPRLARLQAAGERVAQRQIAQRSMMLSYILHAGLVLTIAASLPIVLSLRGSEVQVPQLLWLLIGLAGYLQKMGSMHLQLYTTTNHVLLHWANGLAAVMFVGFVAALLPSLGVYSFPVANTLALMLVYIPISVCHSYPAYGLPIATFEMKTSLGPISLILAAIFWIQA